MTASASSNSPATCCRRAGTGTRHSQKIASGFNRNTCFNEEGGADPEEFVIRYNVDRTNTLGQVWLGLTLGCAECHRHKYDPISQKEYYQLFAYFTGIKEPMISGNHNQPLPPLLKVPSPEQRKTLAKLKRDRADLEREIAAEAEGVRYVDPLEGNAAAVKLPSRPEDVIWLDDAAPPGAKLLGDGTVAWHWDSAPRHPVYSGERSFVRSGQGLHQHYFTDARNPVRIFPDDKLFAYVWLDAQNPPRSIQFQFNDGTWEHRAYWGEDLCYGAGMTDGPGHFSAGALPAAGKWARLEVDAAKIGLAPGARVDGMAFIQFDGTAYYDKIGVATRYPPDPRIYLSQAAWEPRGMVDPRVPADVREALQVDRALRSAAQKTSVRNYYLLAVCAATRELFDPRSRSSSKSRPGSRKSRMPYPRPSLPRKCPRPARRMCSWRGDFSRPGESVYPAVPALLPPLPPQSPNNRLGLAQWLFRPDHPLTARVAVNRLWAQMFGAGLVATPGDFRRPGGPAVPP